VIVLRRLNGQEFVLNADQIESIEANPDTRIRLINGKNIVVKNDIGEVVKKSVKYRQLCNSAIRVVKDQTQGESR